MESNDSPEIPDRGETSDIPGLPSGAWKYKSNRTVIMDRKDKLPTSEEIVQFEIDLHLRSNELIRNVDEVTRNVEEPLKHFVLAPRRAYEENGFLTIYYKIKTTCM